MRAARDNQRQLGGGWICPQFFDHGEAGAIAVHIDVDEGGAATALFYYPHRFIDVERRDGLDPDVLVAEYPFDKPDELDVVVKYRNGVNVRGNDQVAPYARRPWPFRAGDGITVPPCVHRRRNQQRAA